MGPSLSSYFCIPETWQTYGFTDTDPKEFLQEFQDVWPLILPVSECKRVMELGEKEPLNKVKDEINVLWEHCEAGKALFSSAVRGIASELLQDRIQHGLSQLKGDAAVEEKAVSTTLAAIYDDIAKIAGLDTLHGRRSVAMGYRGLTLQVQVADPREQVSLSLRLAVRERASITGVLKCLPGEGLLPSTSATSFSVAASAVSKASTARAQLHRLLLAEGDDALSGDTVLVPRASRSTQLLQTQIQMEGGRVWGWRF